MVELLSYTSREIVYRCYVPATGTDSAEMKWRHLRPRDVQTCHMNFGEVIRANGGWCTGFIYAWHIKVFLSWNFETEYEENKFLFFMSLCCYKYVPSCWKSLRIVWRRCVISTGIMFGSETHTFASQLIDHEKNIITSQMEGCSLCFYADLTNLLSVSCFEQNIMVT